MVFKVLAIGDLANGFVDLSKIVKNTEIHIINFQWDTASKLTESKDVEFFESLKISELDDKLNKDNKILRHLITSIKSTDSLIAADKMDEVPEMKRSKK